jgi:hypothetical protein
MQVERRENVIIFACFPDAESLPDGWIRGIRKAKRRQGCPTDRARASQDKPALPKANWG